MEDICWECGEPTDLGGHYCIKCLKELADEIREDIKCEIEFCEANSDADLDADGEIVCKS